MRKTRVIPERDKKPKFTPQKSIQSNMNEPDLYLHLESSHRTSPQTWSVSTNVCQIPTIIDYNRPLIKQLLNNNQ